MSTTWTALVPIRDFRIGKTRLRKTLASTGSPWDAAELSRAFAADVVLALHSATEIDRVIVVADRALELNDCELWVQPTDLDLNRALEWAVGQVGDDSRCLIAMADLPCLNAADLDVILTMVDTDEGFVRDSDGTGTSLLIPTGSTTLRFGTDSAAAHSTMLTELTQWASAALRQDVDDYDGLLAARTLGVGPNTARLIT